MKQIILLLVTCLSLVAANAQNRRFNLPGQEPDSLNKINESGKDSLSKPTEKKAADTKASKPVQKKEGFWKRSFTGGGFGLSFGTITNINLSPQFGYRITDNFWAGVGVTYIYFSQRYSGYPKFQTNIYGGRVFLRYIVWKGIFVHAENEMLNMQRYDDLNNRVWVNSLMAGGGYQQSLGGNSSVYLMGLFNFTESKYTPYINPIIRFGFNIGL